MNNKIIYQKALLKWGFKNQSIMLMEECSELIQAVSKLHRTGNPEPMYEEMADVRIMVEQILEGCDEEAKNKVEKYYKSKSKRLEGLVENA
jgi:NTP pyrophosphatase (non-canonical NTP hydrolase)